MKRIAALFIILTLLVVIPQPVYAQGQAFAETIQVQTGKGVRDVKAVWIDMKDPLYRAEVAIANGQIGQTDSFTNIVNQLSDNETEIVAAINGTFFNSYTDQQPAGTIRVKGKDIYFNNTGTCIGFSGSNDVSFAHVYISVSGSINGNWEYPYNWGVWGINQLYDSEEANIMYTPNFGKVVDAGSKTAIVVQNGRVTAIQKGITPIPGDGYTLVFGADVYANMFKIGDKIDYRVDTNHIDFSSGVKKGAHLEWSHIRTALGAGPMLIENGKIILNAQKEGFTEERFTTNSAQRSFIGQLDDNILVFGTVADVTLSELATILKNMNVKNGMNLDGGASSALFFGGEILTTPTRKLSNVLVITRKKTRPVRLQLNGKELFLDTDPYFENNTTMVPMRGIAEALGAEAGWDPETGTLWLEKQGNRVEMWNNSTLVKVNGVEQQLLAPVKVVYNRTHVPVRFMTELFGGSVYFDNNNHMVVMTMENADANNIYSKAVEEINKGNGADAEKLLLQVLELDPGHAGAMLKLAIYYAGIGDNQKAKIYYEQFVAIQPDDLNAWNSLGWIYGNLGDIPNAIKVFDMLTRKMPQQAAYWSALGDMYAHYQIQDYGKAKECYEKALACNPSDSMESSLNEKLKKLEK